MAGKFSKRIVKLVAKSATVNNNRLHIMPRAGKWVVRRDGAVKASGIFTSKEQAIASATKRITTGEFAYVIIHDRTGAISEKLPA